MTELDEAMVELLPCPICGKHAFVCCVGYEVWCSTDSCLRLPARATRAEAITAWNKRAQPPAPPEQPEQIDREAERKLTLWFFRECNAGTRKHLFALFGLPVDEIRCEGHERLAFNHILASHRRLGIEQGKRMAGGDMEYAAEMLANFARDRFANTKELTWATMGEHSQQYFRDAVEVVRAALTEQQEEAP